MIHAYKLNGHNIVLDVESGSVHCVDEAAFDVILLYENVPKEQIIAEILQKYADNETVTRAELLALFDDIEKLKAGGKLFAPELKIKMPARAKTGEIKALCLHVSHACNLTCDYCFASQGRYDGARALMTQETGRQAIDFLVANSGKRRNLEVDFFGGEPLLNWETVKEIVRYARGLEKERDKNFRFTLTTNGVLLDDEVIGFANREMYNVVLSLDGRKEIHDARRRAVGGGGSYDLIVPKFQELVAKRGGKNYYIRGTFTHENTDFTRDILHMAELGFTELSMEPVVAARGEPYALTEDDMPELLRQYEILAVEMLRREKEGRAFTFYHYTLDLAHGPCIYKRVAGCGSGTEYLAVTPWGELFPCHQFVGKPEFSMGNLTDGITKPEIREEFGNCGALTREKCRNCWARLYCSGGCAANAFNAAGAVGGVYEYGCELFKKRVECAIMMKAAAIDG